MRDTVRDVTYVGFGPFLGGRIPTAMLNRWNSVSSIGIVADAGGRKVRGKQFANGSLPRFGTSFHGSFSSSLVMVVPHMVAGVAIIAIVGSVGGMVCWNQ